MKKNIYSLPLSLLVISGAALQAVTPRIAYEDERRVAFRVRMAAARKQTLDNPPVHIDDKNPNETPALNYAGSFTKGFSHDPITGEVDGAGFTSFERLYEAMHTGKQADFNAIALAGARKLVCPQVALTYTVKGLDSALFTMHSTFSIQAIEAVAQMFEIYLAAICRDVRFDEYGTGVGTDLDPYHVSPTTSKTSNAAAILQALGSAYEGPRDGGVVNASVVFRGLTTGDLTGPYLSQFMWLDLYPVHEKYPASNATKQKYPSPTKHEFGVKWDDFVELENGNIPVPLNNATDFAPTTRYIINGRDLANWAHLDGPYEAYYNAINILATNGFPFAPNLPYYQAGVMPKEAGFVNMAVVDVYTAAAYISRIACEGAWAAKWRSYRSLRPEAMAGLVHRYKMTGLNPRGLDPLFLSNFAGIDVLDWVLQYNQEQAPTYLTLPDASTWLLSSVYPEASPLHPSYPSGHATAAGACTTIIKAFFNDTALISSKVTPMVPDATGANLVPYVGPALTVGGELDKLASNISWGRNFANVHYRQDADHGMELGEQIGICYLQDCAREYTESGFTGFEFTKRNGVRIRVTANAVINI